jgi:two-component system chemotaxis sensor kinase CheA
MADNLNAAPSSGAAPAVNLDAQKLDALMNLSGELAITRARFSQLVGALALESARLREMSHKVGMAKNRTDVSRGGNVNTEEINNVLGEIGAEIARSKTANLLHSLDEMTSTLGKISGDIQAWVMLSRMVPVEDIFMMLRERVLSQMDQKTLPAITLEGNGAQLDKRIADALGNPLENLIQAVADHTITSCKDCGESRAPSIVLRSHNRDNNIWIEIASASAQLDAAAIVRAMVKKGLLSDSQAQGVDNKQALHLLLSPDFPPGDGMAPLARALGAAKEAVSALNGAADIENLPGGGMQVVLKIPLTLVIVKALLVVLGGETYAFPLNSVVEIVKTSPGEVYSVDGNDTIKLRDHALSLVDLPAIIGIGCDAAKKNAAGKVVVITDGMEKLGVPVDALIGEEEIVIKSLPEHFSSVKGIAGASILGDGTVTLILDPAAIIGMAR